MPTEPPTKRTVAFVDGQNLYYGVREAFGYTYPNYDVRLLVRSVCAARGWDVVQARFHTGDPDRADDTLWHQFWANKLEKRIVATLGQGPLAPALARGAVQE